MGNEQQPGLEGAELHNFFGDLQSCVQVEVLLDRESFDVASQMARLDSQASEDFKSRLFSSNGSGEDEEVTVGQTMVFLAGQLNGNGNKTQEEAIRALLVDFGQSYINGKEREEIRGNTLKLFNAIEGLSNGGTPIERETEEVETPVKEGSFEESEPDERTLEAVDIIANEVVIMVDEQLVTPEADNPEETSQEGVAFIEVEFVAWAREIISEYFRVKKEKGKGLVINQENWIINMVETKIRGEISWEWSRPLARQEVVKSLGDIVEEAKKQAGGKREDHGSHEIVNIVEELAKRFVNEFEREDEEIVEVQVEAVQAVEDSTSELRTVEKLDQVIREIASAGNEDEAVKMIVGILPTEKDPQTVLTPEDIKTALASVWSQTVKGKEYLRDICTELARQLDLGDVEKLQEEWNFYSELMLERGGIPLHSKPGYGEIRPNPVALGPVFAKFVLNKNMVRIVKLVIGEADVCKKRRSAVANIVEQRINNLLRKDPVLPTDLARGLMAKAHDLVEFWRRSKEEGNLLKGKDPACVMMKLMKKTFSALEQDKRFGNIACLEDLRKEFEALDQHFGDTIDLKPKKS